MGLLKAITGAAGSALADQWRDYIYCDSLDGDTIVAKGEKRTTSRSANTKGSLDIISQGSIISIADGQCMIIVEQGKIIDVCAEPGEYIYDSSTEPSVFTGKLDKENIFRIFEVIGKRFTYGGMPAMDQRVYYFNTKEFTGNPYGTPAPVPFRVVDHNIGLDIDITIRCFGEYSYKITNPLLFYQNVCGNIQKNYKRQQIDTQLKSELLTSLQPAFAAISEKGIRYSTLPKHTEELANSLNIILSDKWKNTRGIEISSLAISSVKANEKDEEIIKELQRNAVFKDPTMAAAQLVGAQSIALQEAAKNTGAGAAMALMGMHMVKGVDDMQIKNLFEMGARKEGQEAGDSKAKWKCICGKEVIGNYCPFCGKPRSGVIRIQCNQCGWTATEADTMVRFCPQCGTPLEK